MVVLFLFELLIYTFYSPDVDAINGLKTAAQAGLQNIVIVSAALVATGAVESNSGEWFCIQISLVQVFLAIPEQIWGIVSKTILRKSGPPGEPDFKTTDKEIMLASKKKSVTVKQKLKACYFVLKSIKSMRHVLQEGDLANILVEVLIRKDLLLNLDLLESGCLCEILALIFLCPKVQNFLEAETKKNPLICSDVEMILKNRWQTSVDFLEGVLHIFRIRDTMELGLQGINECESKDVVENNLSQKSLRSDSPKIMYTEFLPTYIANLEPLLLEDFNEYLPEPKQGLPMPKKSYIPYSNVVLADLVYHNEVGTVVDVFGSSGERLAYDASLNQKELQPTKTMSGELRRARQTTMVEPAKTQRDMMQSFMGVNREFHSDSAGYQRTNSCAQISSAARKKNGDGRMIQKQEPLKNQSVLYDFTANTESEGDQQIFKEFMKTAIGGLIDVCSCTNPGTNLDKHSHDSKRKQKSVVSELFQAWHLATASISNEGSKNDLEQSSNHHGIVDEIEAKALTQKKKNKADPQVTNCPSELDVSSSAHIEISSADKQEAFKEFIKRLVGAMDSETMDKLQETLMNKLPEQFTAIFDEVPSAIGAAASFYSLETEKDDGDGDNGDDDANGESEKVGMKVVNKNMQETNGHVVIKAHEIRPEKTAEVTLCPAPAAQVAAAAKRGVSTVKFSCWFAWDLFLFSIMVVLVLCTLFLITALAKTSCGCPNVTNT